MAPAAPVEPKGEVPASALKFEALSETSVPVIAEAAHEIHSLEPAVFHDNASDSFLSQMPMTPEAATEPVNAKFEPEAALSDTHGLHVKTGADVIPIRPDISNPALDAAISYDPVEAALLAETPAVL